MLWEENKRNESHNLDERRKRNNNNRTQILLYHVKCCKIIVCSKVVCVCVCVCVCVLTLISVRMIHKRTSIK
eukprot:UN10857